MKESGFPNGVLLTSCVSLVLALSSCGGVSDRTLDDSHFDITAQQPTEDVVQLRHATLPSALGLLAVHCWLVAYDSEEKTWSRWEVWQRKNAGGQSWGHLHKNLMELDEGVGGGETKIRHEWRGSDAQKILAVLNRPSDYPHKDTYRAWPGPNCNTYVSWILTQAGIKYDLPSKALGKNY